MKKLPSVIKSTARHYYKLLGLRDVPNPTVCNWCDKKAIYMFSRLGACASHKSNLSIICKNHAESKNARNQELESSVYFDSVANKKHHSSYAKRTK